MITLLSSRFCARSCIATLAAAWLVGFPAFGEDLKVAYDRPIKLTGFIEIEARAESDERAKTDAPVYILALANPIAIQEDPATGGSRQKVSRLQIVGGPGKTPASGESEKLVRALHDYAQAHTAVSVEGSIFPAMTVHHQAPALITLDKISATKPQ